MKRLLYTILYLNVFLSYQIGWTQNKTDIPSTYNEVCYFTIKKVEFEDYLVVKKAIEREEYATIYAAIRKMRASLKGFSTANHSRAFELWYIGNYTEFEQQAMVSKESTLASLDGYESRLRTRDALYYEHRLFLDQYLAFQTEAFYPEYWFMSQERYFSRDVVKRVNEMNPEEGKKLFINSEFYRPFDVFNEMALTEENEIKDYLDVEDLIADTTSYIPYSYMAMDKTTASYVLNNLKLDDASQQLDLDRQIKALKLFLEQVKSDKIYFVARFNHLELRKVKALEEGKRK